jgi:hypothetical protein
MEQLFEQVQKIVSHPHTALTEHDKVRAAKIFMMLNDFVYKTETVVNEDAAPGEEYAYTVNSKDMDFGSFVFDMADENLWKKINEIKC